MINPRYQHLNGVYEYCGLPGCGKSTLIVRDYFYSLTEWENRPTYSNLYIDKPPWFPNMNITFMKPENLLEYMIWLFDKEITNWCSIFDEAGLYINARNFGSKQQTKFCNSCYQMNKRGQLFFFTSNAGNSVDIVLKSAARITYFPHYYDGPPPYILCDGIDNYSGGLDHWEDDYIGGLEHVFPYFNTLQPV